MVNVYQQIASNKRRSAVIIFIFVAFIIGTIYFIAQSFDYQALIPLAIIFSTGSALASYFAGDKLVLALNHAKPANRKQFFDFYTVTENLSLASDMPVPQMYVIESAALNAFATGRDPQHATVCATTGLLAQLNRTELEGVISHELSHIKNYDTRLMTIVSILIGTLSIFINFASRSLFWGGGGRDRDDRRGGDVFAILGIITIIFAPIIAQLIQLAISRRREFYADASGVMLTRQPNGLISALKKISGDTSVLATASTATTSLYISNPFKGNKLASLFSTHPPIADRIQALEKML